MKIKVQCPCRLHFGIIDMHGGLGRLYGSIGVGIKTPQMTIVFEKSQKLKVIGSTKKTVKNYAELYINSFGLNSSVKINVVESIDEHVGLGSGTQTSLAVGMGISELYGLGKTPEEVALISKRGHVSGIGSAVFRHGGFVVDAGHRRMSPELPPVTFHSDFPTDWRFLLIIPKVRFGLFAGKEIKAFEDIIPASGRTAAEISRILQMKMLPALMETDIRVFGSSLVEIDRLVGSYFLKAQSGLYKEKATADIINYLLDGGCYGAGQSSWGPSVYALTNEKEANVLQKDIGDFLKKKKISAKVYLSKADNQGAKIQKLKSN